MGAHPHTPMSNKGDVVSLCDVQQQFISRVLLRCRPSPSPSASDPGSLSSQRLVVVPISSEVLLASLATDIRTTLPPQRPTCCLSYEKEDPVDQSGRNAKDGEVQWVPAGISLIHISDCSQPQCIHGLPFTSIEGWVRDYTTPIVHRLRGFLASVRAPLPPVNEEEEETDKQLVKELKSFPHRFVLAAGHALWAVRVTTSTVEVLDGKQYHQRDRVADVPLLGSYSSPGFTDGSFDRATFRSPGAMCWKSADFSSRGEAAASASSFPHGNHSGALSPSHQQESACHQLFISDVGNHAIRLANFSTRMVRTIVGWQGIAGYRDGGAVNALMAAATAMLYTSRGLLFTDGPNKVVRLVTGNLLSPGDPDPLEVQAAVNRLEGLLGSSQQKTSSRKSSSEAVRVWTVAGGGKGASYRDDPTRPHCATFGSLTDMAVVPDSSGGGQGIVYVSDAGHHAVRALTPHGVQSLVGAFDYGKHRLPWKSPQQLIPIALTRRQASTSSSSFIYSSHTALIVVTGGYTPQAVLLLGVPEAFVSAAAAEHPERPLSAVLRLMTQLGTAHDPASRQRRVITEVSWASIEDDEISSSVHASVSSSSPPSQKVESQRYLRYAFPWVMPPLHAHHSVDDTIQTLYVHVSGQEESTSTVAEGLTSPSISPLKSLGEEDMGMDAEAHLPPGRLVVWEGNLRAEKTEEEETHSSNAATNGETAAEGTVPAISEDTFHVCLTPPFASVPLTYPRCGPLVSLRPSELFQHLLQRTGLPIAPSSSEQSDAIPSVGAQQVTSTSDALYEVYLSFAFERDTLETKSLRRSAREQHHRLSLLSLWYYIYLTGYLNATEKLAMKLAALSSQVMNSASISAPSAAKPIPVRIRRGHVPSSSGAVPSVDSSFSAGSTASPVSVPCDGPSSSSPAIRLPFVPTVSEHLRIDSREVVHLLYHACVHQRGYHLFAALGYVSFVRLLCLLTLWEERALPLLHESTHLTSSDLVKPLPYIGSRIDEENVTRLSPALLLQHYREAEASEEAAKEERDTILRWRRYLQTGVWGLLVDEKPSAPLPDLGEFAAEPLKRFHSAMSAPALPEDEAVRHVFQLLILNEKSLWVLFHAFAEPPSSVAHGATGPHHPVNPLKEVLSLLANASPAQSTCWDAEKDGSTMGEFLSWERYRRLWGSTQLYPQHISLPQLKKAYFSSLATPLLRPFQEAVSGAGTTVVPSPLPEGRQRMLFIPFAESAVRLALTVFVSESSSSAAKKLQQFFLLVNHLLRMVRLDNSRGSSHLLQARGDPIHEVLVQWGSGFQ